CGAPYRTSLVALETAGLRKYRRVSSVGRTRTGVSRMLASRRLVHGKEVLAVLRVGIIGLGRWGPNLLRNFHEHPTTRVPIAADADEDRRALIAPKYPTIRLTSAADAVIGADVEAVVIATPTSTHYQLVRDALLAGKHVLVEKPITADAGQACELAELAAA